MHWNIRKWKSGTSTYYGKVPLTCWKKHIVVAGLWRLYSQGKVILITMKRSTGTWWAPQGPRSGKVYLTFWHVITLVSAELGVWVIEAMSHESFRWCNRLRHWEISRTTLHSMKQCSMLSKSSDLRSLVSQTSVVAAIWTFCSRNTVFIKAFNQDIESGWQNMVSVLINVPCKATFVLQ